MQAKFDRFTIGSLNTNNCTEVGAKVKDKC